jgi:hypothetical protein
MTCICSLLGFFFFFWWVLDGALYQVFLMNQSQGVKTDNGGWILGMGFFFPHPYLLGEI